MKSITRNTQLNSLRIRFAIGFSILFTLILGTALVIIYISYADFTKDEFHNRLRDRAMSTFKLLIEVDQVDYELLKVIDDNTMTSLHEEKVLIYENDSLIYKSGSFEEPKLDKGQFEAARENGIFHTTEQESALIVMHRHQDGHDYILVASAYDKYGRRKLNFLKIMIIIVFASGLVIGWMATYLFVKTVISPLDRLNTRIEEIHSENLHTRVPVEGQMKELDRLAINFNRMLERLQQSFGFQKDFVHYASHELRTPLTAMIGVTENAMNKQMRIEEHQGVLRQLFQQQKDLAGITNSLLLLSNKNNSEIDYPHIRLDELLFRSIEIMRNLYPESNIQVHLEGDIANEENMMVNANEALILIAFNNLLKNAVQYSTGKEPVKVYLKCQANSKMVEFHNHGQGFTSEENQQIFTPFFRGNNVNGTRGHGLGLPLVRQIAELNGAAIEYIRSGSVNVFRLTFFDHYPATKKVT